MTRGARVGRTARVALTGLIPLLRLAANGRQAERKRLLKAAHAGDSEAQYQLGQALRERRWSAAEWGGC